MGRSQRLLFSRGNRLHGYRPRPAQLSVGLHDIRVFTSGHVFLFTGTKWVGIWPVARYVRGTMGVPGYPGYVRMGGKPVKKKNAAKPESLARHVAPVETNLFAGIMPLVEHMAVTKYDDNDSREPGWLTIRTQGSAWAVVVKDPDSGNSFTSVAETLDKALETAALLLSCDEAPWAPDAYLKRTKKK